MNQDSRTIPTINEYPFADVVWMDGERPTRSPADMVEIVQAYQRLEELAQTDVPNQGRKNHIDWGELFRENLEFFPRHHDIESLAPADPPTEAELDAWLKFVSKTVQRISGKATEPDTDSLSGEEFDALLGFLTKPTPEVAATHAWLKQIPDAVETAAAIGAARRQAFAEFVLGFERKPKCLWSDLTVPPALSGQVAGTLQCWMFVVPDTQGIGPEDLDDARLYHFEAVFIDALPNGDAKVIALVRGYYIVPTKDDLLMHPDSFVMLMDAHSGYLNDAWKAIVGRFLPEHNWTSLEEFYDAVDEMPAGMAVVSLHVADAYQGRKLSSFLLESVVSMTERADELDALAPDDDGEWDDLQPLTPGSLARAPIRLFVLAIEGTEPSNEDSPIEIEKAYDPESLAKPRVVVNASVEKRRLSLTRYFNGIGAKAEGYFIHTYNPWDYPVT